MLPACYQDIFAFRPDQSCISAVTPTSGLYIDDLEGISLTTAGGNGKHTYKNAQDLLNAKTALSLQKIEIDLQAVMKKRGYMLPQLQPATNLCKFQTTTQDASSIGRGVTLYRSHGATALSNIYVEKVMYKAKTSGSATLVIQDLYGNVLYISAANAVTADSPLQFLVLGSFAVDVRILVITNTQPYDASCDNNCDCLHNNNHNHKKGVGAPMYKVVGYDGTDDANSAFGVIVCGAVRCNIQAFVCYILDIIKMPLRYMVGAAILREIRANNGVTAQASGYYQKDIQLETIKDWEAMAQAQLHTQMDTIIQNLTDYDKHCVSCKTPNRIFISSLT